MRVASWWAAGMVFAVVAVTVGRIDRASAQAEAAPVIERVEPTSGPPGTLVHVIGRRFGSAAEVQLGRQPLVIVDNLPNRLSVRIPEGVPSERIAVSNGAGTVRGPEFRVTARPPAPVIDSIEPREGPPGATVVLRGKNFSPRLTANLVTLGGLPVIVSRATPVELRVIVPEVERSGPFVVRVDHAGEAKSTAFEVTAATRIQGFEPERAGPGAQLTIQGSGFSSRPADNRVYLNSARLEVKRASATELVVELPKRIASGKLLVDVKGAGRAYSDRPFQVQFPPSLAEFTPKGGPPGTLVTVRGTNLGTEPGAVEAKLGDSALVVRRALGTRLELVTPEGAQSGKLSIRVQGVGPAVSEQAFSVLEALAITRFSPQTGPAGSQVVIEGQGFGALPGHNRVTIGGQLAPVIEASPHRLRVRVPKGPSGPIEIRVQSSGAVRTTAPFVITVPPKVSNISPMRGSVGTQLCIEGSGFGDNPAVLKVLLGGHPLAVESVRDDIAIVRVTSGAKSGRVKVAVPLQGVDEFEQEFELVRRSSGQPASTAQR